MTTENELNYSAQAEEYLDLLLSHYADDELSELVITPDGQLEHSAAG